MDAQGWLPLTPRDLTLSVHQGTAPWRDHRAVKERSRPACCWTPPNLYRVLRRMSRGGWIGRAEDAAEDAGRRRTYSVTATGRALLHAEVARMERLLRQARPALASGGREKRV